jgi:hypothetical protein
MVSKSALKTKENYYCTEKYITAQLDEQFIARPNSG